jgi:hypothetical protein
MSNNRNTYMWQSQKYISWKGVSRREAVPGNARPITNGSWKLDHPDLSGNVIDEDGNAFKARPIKHWRKQLVPDATRGGTKPRLIDDTSKPGGTVYLGGAVGEENKCCNQTIAGSSGYNIIAPISIYKNNINCNTAPCSYTVTAEDVDNGWNGPIGKKICCTPETNIIKSATTILSKKYYTDSRSYLKSRAKLYEQKLSTHPKIGIEYYASNGKLLYPNDEMDGPQTFLTGKCVNVCPDGSQPTTIYKPNNRQYGVQGGVSSSTRIEKLKRDTVHTSASSFRTFFGEAAANAGSYKLNGNTPYFIKTKFAPCVTFHRNGNSQLCK